MFGAFYGDVIGSEYGKKHVRRIKERYSGIIADKTVVCLNIPDDYNYMEDDLCELLESIVPEYL